MEYSAFLLTFALYHFYFWQFSGFVFRYFSSFFRPTIFIELCEFSLVLDPSLSRLSLDCSWLLLYHFSSSAFATLPPPAAAPLFIFWPSLVFGFEGYLHCQRHIFQKKKRKVSKKIAEKSGSTGWRVVGVEGRKGGSNTFTFCIIVCESVVCGRGQMINEFVINEACGQKLKILFTHSFGIRFLASSVAGATPEGGGGIYPKDISNYEGRRESGEAAPLIASSDISSPTVFGQKLASLTLAFPLATPSVFTCFSPNFPAFLLTSPPGCVFCYANFSGIFQTNGEAQQQIFRFCK